jgi:purine catabolism regulator
MPTTDQAAAPVSRATLTVAQLLELDVVQRADPQVLAGAAQLGRAVRWVHISEQPDIASYLKGGELLLTTGMGLGTDGRSRRRFIRQLAGAHVAGLLIRLGGGFSEVPPELIDESERHGLPLVLLRRRIGFVEVTERVHGAIINRQLELLRRAEQVRREFTDLVLRGVSLQRILQRLAGLIGNAVVLEDAAHQVVEFAGHGREPSDLLADWERHSRTYHRETADAGVQVELAGANCAWVPIWLRSDLWGRVHVLQDDHLLDEIDLLAIDRAAAAISLALLAERDARSASDQARSALIGDVLSGRLGNPEEFLRRAHSLGMKPSGAALAVLAVEPQGLAGFVAEEGLVERERQEIRTAVLEHARAAIGGAGLSSLSGLDGDRALAILSVPRGEELRPLLSRIGADACQRIAGSWAGRITPVVGISEEATASLLRRALVQAGEAAEYGARVSAGPAVYHYGDLGVYHLLLPLADGPRLARYVEAELGPLLQHDARGRSPLVPTLKSFLDHGGQVSPAARELFIERRTLYHRMAVIGRLTGRDLSNPDTRLRLSVALRALDLLQTRHGGDRPLRHD